MYPPRERRYEEYLRKKEGQDDGEEMKVVGGEKGKLLSAAEGADTDDESAV